MMPALLFSLATVAVVVTWSYSGRKREWLAIASFFGGLFGLSAATYAMDT
jgi:hypothetical protein